MGATSAKDNAQVQVHSSKKEEATLKMISDGSNKFAIKLYKELIKTKKGNVFVSPLSVQMVLALAYTGAGGATAKELKSVLSLPDSMDQTLSGYLSLLKNLQDPVLTLANRMFVEKTVKINDDFQKNAKEFFLAPAGQLKFRTHPEKSRERINLWVENQTNKKITDIVPSGVIDVDTRMVLVNAMHFKADWKLKFDEDNTRPRTFHVSPTEQQTVLMMHFVKALGFYVSDALKSKILELEYKDMQFRMIIVLPHEVDGLAKLEKSLDKVDLYNELNHLKNPIVSVILPSFQMEKTVDLNSILKSMGAKTMFGDSADFSKLTDDKLSVSQVIQKAFVEVNEKGTEAPAANRMIATRMFRPIVPDPQQFFVADHPFLFAIMHKTTNTTLFLGRYTRPDE